MIKILIAGADVNNNQNFCRFFIYDKKFFVYNALTVNDVLDKYSTMEPNILIIGTSLGVSNCINIINKISSLSNISNKCYTIIVATLDETNNIIFKLKNILIMHILIHHLM